MYDGLGRKLQRFALLMCVLGIVGSVILAFVFGFDRRYREWEFLAVPFFCWLLIGSAVSYLEYLVLCCLGELVDNSERTRQTVDELNKSVAQLLRQPPQPAAVKRPPVPPRTAAPAAPVPERKDAPRPVERPAVPAENGAPVVPMPAGDGKVTCPVCGTVQRSNRQLCMNCAVPFVRAE